MMYYDVVTMMPGVSILCRYNRGLGRHHRTAGDPIPSLATIILTNNVCRPMECATMCCMKAIGSCIWMCERKSECCIPNTEAWVDIR